VKVNRNFSVFVQFILDEWVPPRIRDSKIFMTLPMKFVLKGAAGDFMTFKNWFFKADSKAISDLYEKTAHVQELQGETDLNPQCIDKILSTISTNNVLEVGAGRAYLANLISEKHNVTACDIVIPEQLKKKFPKIKFVPGDIENLPFKDNEYETVISTHTLEHTKNLPRAISELRRVASKELIIVVPRQRPYKYTFSLHTQFFPYEWSITNSFGYRKKSKIEKLGDWFYYEQIS
jgi:ubiquinone/menaquinone biosynthesis C-methylase UbiE